ncbi:MAG: hypothetical protein ACI311_00155 [Bacilli bacterium]
MKVYLENKFISIGGDSKVCDEKGNQLFFVDGKALSITRKKIIKEMPSKKVLYVVKNRPFFNIFAYKTHVYNSKHEKVFTLKVSKISLKYKITHSKHNIVFDKKLVKTSAPVLIDNVEVAKINVELFSSIFTDCFSIETEDPTLIPFLVAIVVAFDNIRDKQAR